MNRSIAFLRAVNVGGRTVTMDELRRLFEALGFAQVETFIASGNVIFRADDAGEAVLAARIEAHLKQALGYQVAVFLRTPGELAEIVGRQPFAPASVAAARALWVGVLRAPPDDAAAARLRALGSSHNQFHLHGRELYWLRHTSEREATVSGAQIERALATPTTMRNITTLRTLAAKYPATLP
jgi:uncharacterized protein (DUF1697 family)